jgi:Type III secretion needle MxiH, YscF, SsaG, EprI, PscF, EscF
MSFISGLLGGSNILSAALNIASMMFPAAQMASSLLKAFSGMMQDVLKGAMQQLVKDSGMPKFLADAVNKLVDQIFGGAKGGGAGADQSIQQQMGDLIKNLGKELMKSFVESVKESMNGGSADEGKETKNSGGKGGWLVALAKAFGKIADKAAKELDQAGKNLNKENPSEMIEYQAKTQEFAQMMNTFINAIKTIGEAQTTAVRKG